MTTNERVSDERLSTLANLQSPECMALPAGHNEVAMLARELQQYRAAAEHAALKKFIREKCFVVPDGASCFAEADECAEKSMPETPATDAWVNEQRAAGRVEGVNFAAARLAAAFNHGFIDKPTAEVYDVVKAVLGAKEELATAPEDGLSGEYAEQALNDWAAQLRGSQV